MYAQSVLTENAEDSSRLGDHIWNWTITLSNIPVAFLSGLQHIIFFTFVLSDEKTVESQKGFLRFYPSLLIFVFALTPCDICAAIRSQIWLSACGMWSNSRQKDTHKFYFGWWILLEAVSENLACEDMLGLFL